MTKPHGNTFSIEPTFRSPRHDAYREAGGPWEQPSLDALLTSAGRRASERIVVVDGPHRVSGNDLNDRVRCVARSLLRHGVSAGDAVAWQLPNGIDVVVVMRACWRIGAIAVPLHHGFSPIETDRLIRRINPKLVVDDAALVRLQQRGFDELDRVRVTAEDVQRTDLAENAWTDGEALAAILFTSGSSGTPKGVLHSQNTLAYKAMLMASVHQLTEHDVVLMPAPLAHVSGLLNGITLAGAVPFRAVLMARWDAGTALDLIEREGVTFMVGPPTFFLSLLNHPAFSSERVASLRLISSGGAGVSEAFVMMASRRFDAVIKRTYGSTEAPSVATSTNGDASEDAHSHDGRAIGAVELRQSTTGELFIRGPEVCLGYLDPEHTDAAFTEDGWYRSGDLATLDDNGWLNIIGRLNDVIIRGGENIAAAEVEAIIAEHSAVESVVVIGVPDELMGERVGACIVANDSDPDRVTLTVDALRAWCIERGLAKYKCAERITLIDTMPLLASGKPDRMLLRTIAASRLSDD